MVEKNIIKLEYKIYNINLKEKQEEKQENS